MKDNHGVLVLVACTLVMIVLGSVHAFSVFLIPVETLFGVSRADASLAYSIALATLTTMVLISHHVFSRLSPAILVLAVAVVAASGLMIAGHAEQIEVVWFGYGVLFGGANGLGYVFSLQMAAQANPQMRGGAMGLVTAAYGLGAALAPVPLDALMDMFGFSGGLAGLAMAILAVGPIAAFLLRCSGKRLTTDANKDGGERPSFGALAVMWISYGAAVAAGLMAIGHATGIAADSGLGGKWVVCAPVVIAVANIVGSFLGGYLVDVFNPRRLLQMIVALSAITLVVMAMVSVSWVALFGLGLIGFTYGATIGAFPAAIASKYGPVLAVSVYGRVFTAWGTAGLIAPWAAGILYQEYNDYVLALLMATVLAFISFVSIYRFPSGYETS